MERMLRDVDASSVYRLPRGGTVEIQWHGNKMGLIAQLTEFFKETNPSLAMEVFRKYAFKDLGHGRWVITYLDYATGDGSQ